MPIIEKKRGKLVTKRIQEHYGPNIYEYPIIGEITLNEINIPETAIEHGDFPGVNRKVGFAMMLESKMAIKKEACYEFALNSDDGSILWIDGSEVLNNDGGHQMQLKRDSIVLDKGTYDIKIWYFQGMPDRFGFIFNAKALGDASICTKSLSNKQFELDGNVLFESGDYSLKDNSINQLIMLSDSIQKYKPSIVYVIGHTDSVGARTDNQKLSLKRADSVVKFLKELISNDNIQFSSEGRGESEAKASNDTKEGRSKNRRVEVQFSCISN